MIDESHCIERTFKLHTKKLILEHLQKAMSDQYELKFNVIDSFSEYCVSIDENLNTYISEDESNDKVLNYFYEKISHAKEKPEHEQDPILNLLYLTPEKAIKNIDTMSNRLEFYNYSLKLRNLIESLYQDFHKKLHIIKQAIKTYPVGLLESYKKSEDCFIEPESYTDSLTLLELWKNCEAGHINLEKTTDFVNNTATEFSAQKESRSASPIVSMDQLLVDWTDPKNSIYCIELKGFHLEITKGIIRETGEKIAVKSICSNYKQDVEQFRNEIQIYEKLSKNNPDLILKYYGHFQYWKTQRTRHKV